MDYTWLDFIIILIFFLNIALGAARGIFREIVSIISIIIALIIAIKFTVPLNEYLITLQGFRDVVGSFSTFTKFNSIGPLSVVSFAISFAFLFFAPYSAGEGVNYYAGNMGTLMVFPTLAILERGVGAVLGFIRGYVMSLILILLVGLTPMSTDESWTKSNLIPQLMPKAAELGSMVRPAGWPFWA